ncbi:hypothetical protein VTO42DRAFT_3321 [Malbranchea cinnamomea]
MCRYLRYIYTWCSDCSEEELDEKCSNHEQCNTRHITRRYVNDYCQDHPNHHGLDSDGHESMSTDGDNPDEPAHAWDDEGNVVGPMFGLGEMDRPHLFAGAVAAMSNPDLEVDPVFPVYDSDAEQNGGAASDVEAEKPMQDVNGVVYPEELQIFEPPRLGCPLASNDTTNSDEVLPDVIDTSLFEDWAASLPPPLEFDSPTFLAQPPAMPVLAPSNAELQAQQPPGVQLTEESLPEAALPVPNCGQNGRLNVPPSTPTIASEMLNSFTPGVLRRETTLTPAPNGSVHDSATVTDNNNNNNDDGGEDDYNDNNNKRHNNKVSIVPAAETTITTTNLQPPPDGQPTATATAATTADVEASQTQTPDATSFITTTTTMTTTTTTTALNPSETYETESAAETGAETGPADNEQMPRRRRRRRGQPLCVRKYQWKKKREGAKKDA